MRSVCICFSGFLETQEHSFICNCHLQLIIAWYVLYINSVTFYTCSSEHRLSFDANTPMGNISKRTLVCLFGPKNCLFLCKGDVHRHQEPACVCTHRSPQCSLSETHSTNRRRASQWFSYCSQTLQRWCVYPGSWEKKEDGGARRKVRERVSAYTGTKAGTSCRMAVPAAEGAGGWGSCVSTHSHASISDVYGRSRTRSTLRDECIRIRIPPLLKCSLTCDTSSPCYRLECVLLKGSGMYLSAGL